MRYYYMKKIRQNQAEEQLSLGLFPSQLTVGRQPQESSATFQVSLNRNPVSTVPVTVSSSDPSVAVSPASFVLGGIEPLSRIVSVSGGLSGPDSVTLQVAAAGFSPQTVQVTRPPFLPNAISGLALWLDAADASTITLDGSLKVTEWRDKSGSARHARQGTAGTLPSMTQSFLGAKPGVLFSGLNQGLDLSATWNDLGDNTAKTITEFYVLRCPSSGFPIILDTTLGHKIYAYYGGVTAYYDAGPESTARIFGDVGNGVTNGVLVTASRNGGVVNLRYGSTLVASRADANGDIYGSLNEPVKFRGSETANSVIAEAVVFSRSLTEGETENVQSYLKTKWGTP